VLGNGFRNSGAAGYPQGGNTRTGRHQQRVGMAVVATIKFYNEVPAGCPACQTDGAHGGLGAGVYHAYDINRIHGVDDHLSQLDFQIGGRTEAASPLQH